MQYLVARLALELERVLGRGDGDRLLIGLGRQPAAAGVGQRVGPAHEQREALRRGLGARRERALVQIRRAIECEQRRGHLGGARVVAGGACPVAGAVVVRGQPLRVHRAPGVQRLRQSSMGVGERCGRQRRDHGLAHAIVIRLELAQVAAGAAYHLRRAQRTQQARIALGDAGGRIRVGFGQGTPGHRDDLEEPPRRRCAGG